MVGAQRAIQPGSQTGQGTGRLEIRLHHRLEGEGNGLVCRQRPVVGLIQGQTRGSGISQRWQRFRGFGCGGHPGRKEENSKKHHH